MHTFCGFETILLCVKSTNHLVSTGAISLHHLWNMPRILRSILNAKEANYGQKKKDGKFLSSITICKGYRVCGVQAVNLFFRCCSPEHNCVTMMPVTSDTSLDERLRYTDRQLEEGMLMLCLLMQADDFNGLTVQSQSLAQREDEPLLSPPPPAVPEVIVKLFLFCVRCLYGGLSTVLFHGSGSVNGPAMMIYHSIDLTNEKT